MKKTLLFCIAFLFAFSAFSQHVFDANFAPKFYDYAKAEQALAQPDGKIIVAGNFIEIDGKEVSGLVRLNPDGTLDPSFKFDWAPITMVRRMEIGPDNKIYVLNGSRVGKGQTLLRLFEDGSVDTSFEISLDTEIMEFAILPSGNIVARHFQRHGPLLHMYDAQGKKVEDFQVESNTVDFTHLAVQGEKILALIPSFEEGPSSYKLSRLMPDGKFDPTFDSPVRYSTIPHYHQIVVWPDNKFTLYGFLSSEQRQLARFMPDGELDPTYANPVFGSNYDILKYSPAQNGELFILDREDFREVTLRKLSNQGGQQFSFPGMTLSSEERSESEQGIIPLALPDGGLLVYGAFSKIADHNSFGITKIDLFNRIVENFNPELLKAGSTQVAKMDHQGRLLVGGDFVKVNGHFANSLTRFKRTGEVDVTFTANYLKQRKNAVTDIFINEDHEVYVGLEVPWTSADFLHQLNDQGVLMDDFKEKFMVLSLGDGVRKILPLEDGGFLVGGNFMADKNNLKPQYHLVKFNRDHSFDQDFNVTPHFSNMTRLYTMGISNGQLYTSSFDRDDNYHLKVFGLDGEFVRDSVFQESANYSVRAITALPGGKTLISGGPNRQFSENDSFRNFVLDSLGNITEGNFSHRRFMVNDVQVLLDSTLLWGGTFSSFNNFNTPYIARTDMEGMIKAVDTELNGPIETINYLENGFLALSGTFTEANKQPRFGFAILRGPRISPRIIGIKGPGIFGQNETIDLGDLLEVIDMDNSFPTGYTFKILGNEVGYSIGEGSITTEKGYVGPLTFEVQVNDGERDSNIFAVELQVESYTKIQVLGTSLPEMIAKNGYLEIKLEDLELNLDPEDEGYKDLLIVIEEGEHYSVVDGKIIPDTDYLGELKVTFRVDFGSVEGLPYIHNLLVRDFEMPVIVGTTLTSDRYLNEKIGVTIGELVFEENPEMNLQGFVLKLHAGANYIIEGDTIVPSDHFKGTVRVGISLVKGEEETNVYIAEFNMGALELPRPQITRVALPRVINLNDSLILTLEDLVLSIGLTEQEKEYYKVNISEGENFRINGQSISPVRAFTGKMTIPIFLTAPDYISNVYLWEVTVLDLVIPKIAEVKHEKVIPPGQNLRIKAEDLEFDEDIPADQMEFLKINILPGEHYEVEEEDIIPEKNYEGMITVGLEAEFGKYNTQTAYINFRVSAVTGISMLENVSNKVRTYPNPTTGELNIEVNYLQQGTTMIEVMNPAGKVLLQQLIDKDSEKLMLNLSLANLPNGLYILRIRTQDKVAIKKVQKR
ncbi:T9SS type A sorting domain-containing protein [Litoribacter ruber]|uniref:T9SS type A sorting domain-containing protein n=1 Tax=Litoribacter ruber TaxID=702568 RepID=UPI001BDAB532|nr:T9SS type A sorting domain-containing protein [Litoribacter ruber]MBT0810109.1 T9SS type A sorting domain-containing protein [Litoribacter ruber]